MKRVLQIGLPIVFIVIGVAAFNVMKSMMASAEKSDFAAAVAAVEVVTVNAEDRRAVIEATGTIEASSRVDLVAQVAGQITWVAKGITPGARVKAGEVIAKIDDRDYRAAVTQARSSVDAAELDLQLEENRGRQASREYELLGRDADSPLARREPHLQSAKARLESSEASLTTANLNLERTRLKAPFNAIITSESLDKGKYAAPGGPLATLIGTDQFRVRVSVPVERLRYLDVPADKTGKGSPAVIRQTLADGQVLEVDGYVRRMLGELDPETRTAGVLVAIDEPFDRPEGELPILPGAYVTVQLEGPPVPGTYEVPRNAVFRGDQVWVADPEDKLSRRQIDVLWGTSTHVYTREGLEDGDRVIVTPLSLPIEGMDLDVQVPVAEAR